VALREEEPVVAGEHAVVEHPEDVVAHEFSIGELSSRSGVSQSALRFYKREGLIAARRTDGNQRRYPAVTLRRVALVQAGKAAGIPLERIGAALGTLPEGKSPTKRDWERLSSSWRKELDERIETLEAIRGRLNTVHRLRLPLAPDVRSAQPRRRGSSSRRRRALLA
jgi:MerR family redox-sensitive transcriptional activator SoxR